jgi:hypothetical protein
LNLVTPRAYAGYLLWVVAGEAVVAGSQALAIYLPDNGLTTPPGGRWLPDDFSRLAQELIGFRATSKQMLPGNSPEAPSLQRKRAEIGSPIESVHALGHF